MKVEVITIEPDQAASFLRSSRVKQEINFRKISRLVLQILQGDWDVEKTKHAPVEVSAQGQLYNGHHRLIAVVLADTPVETYFKVNPHVVLD